MANPICPLCHRGGVFSAEAKRMECIQLTCEVKFFGPVEERKTTSTGVRIFPARYAGYCHGCGTRFHEDDDVGFLDDELHCAACVDVLGKAKDAKPIEVCQTCFTAKAANGTCGCD